MRFWKEIEDAFTYFKWFNRKKAVEMFGVVPGLSVFSYNASMIFGLADRANFIGMCNEEIKRIFSQELLNHYEFCLFANVEIKDKNSRIEKYRKVWKSLQTRWRLEDFHKGPELETNLGDKLLYSGIAKFPVESLPIALALVSSDPKKHTIFATKKKNVLTENIIETVANVAFNLGEEGKDEINYFNLSLNFCPQGDIVFRWGDSSDEAELGMIFDEELKELFNDVTAKLLPD